MKFKDFITSFKILTTAFPLVFFILVNDVTSIERFCTMRSTSMEQNFPHKDSPGQLAEGEKVNPNETIRRLTFSIESGRLERDALVLALNNRGIAHRQNGSYDLAISDYNQSITLRPDFAAGYSNRGLAFAKIGQYEVAITDFNQAIRLKPNDPDIYLRRGNAYYDQQAYDLAIADYSQAIELKPDFLLAYVNRYDAYSKKGLEGNATGDLKKIQELDPNFEPTQNKLQLAICGKKSCIIREEPVRQKPAPPSIIRESIQPPPLDPAQIERQRKIEASIKVNNEGVECYKKENIDCAIEKFKEALKWNPDDEAIKEKIEKNLQNSISYKAYKLHQKGNDYYYQRNYDMAIKCYKEAWDLDHDPQTKNNLMIAEEAQKIKDKKTVEQQSEQQKEAELQAKISHMMDNLSKELGSSETSAPLSSDTVDLTFLDPNKPLVVDPRVIKGQKTPEEASKEREKEFKAGAEKNLALLSVKKGDYEKAIFYLMEAQKTNPNDENIKKSLAVVFHLKEDKMANNKTSPRAVALMDAFEYGKTDWKKSLDYLKEWYTANTDNMGIRDAYHFSEGLAVGFDYDFKTREFLPTPFLRQPLSKPVIELTSKGIDAIESKNFGKALHYFKEAQKLSPTHIGIRDTLNYTEGLYAAQQWKRSQSK